MIENDVVILKQMRAELQQRISALDSVIQILEQINFGTNSAETEIEIEEDVPKTKKKKTKNTSFESSIDLTKIPDFNPNGGGIRDE